MKHISETIFDMFGGDPRTMDLELIFQKTREILPIDCLLMDYNVFPLRMMARVRVALDSGEEISAKQLCDFCILSRKCDEAAVHAA